MLKSVTFRTTLIAIACAVSISAHALADQPRKVDVPAGELELAIQKLAEQSGVEFVYSPDQLKGLRTKGVQGEYTAEKAITKLLEGTRLKLTIHESGALLISDAAAGSALSPSPYERRGTEGEGNKGVRLAQANPPEAGGRSREVSTSDGPGPLSKLDLPEILVTGTSVLNMDIERTRDDAQPYVIFDREAIDRSGATNVEDFLKTRLNMNTTSFSYAQSDTTAEQGNSSRINLRGLGANQTLVLVDGHRMAGWNYLGTQQQPDLNGIPLSAIERIEVLPATASAIYGGSATGGVINVVMKRDFSGLETRLTYGNGFSGDVANRRVDLAGGFTLEDGKTNVLITGSYAKTDSLLVGDRDLSARAREHLVATNPAFFLNAFTPPLGATSNICAGSFSCNRAQLTFKDGTPLGSTRTFIPEGYAGTFSDNGAALIANAGSYNLGLGDTAQGTGGARAGLLNSPTVQSISTTIRRRFSPTIQAFLELGGSNSSSEFAVNRTTRTFTLQPSAPNNPFQQAIRVTTPTLGADRMVESTNYTRRAMGGVMVNLPADWAMEADYTWNRTRFYSSNPAPLIRAAGTTAVATGALDILRDTNAFPVDFGEFANAPIINGPGHTTLKDTTLRFAGPVFSLPGGRPTVSVLLEHREDILDDLVQSSGFGDPIVFPSRSQKVDSAYLETRLPFFAEANARPGLEMLELQLAVRRDDYTVHGVTSSIGLDEEPSRFTNRNSSTDPLVGLRWKPIDDLTLRGSFGTGYLPPGVDQLAPSVPFDIPSAGADYGLTDPLRGDEPLGDIVLLGGGNPDLRPETSRSWSAGFIVTPSFLPAFRASVDWTRIEKEDNITTVATLSQTDLENEQFVSGIIVRGQVTGGDPFGVGPVIAINSGFFNIAKADVEAIDFAFDYRWETSRFGSIDAALSGTRQDHLTTQLTPAAPVEENAGVSGNAIVSALKWKAVGTVSWNYRDWTLAWSANYFDSYFLNVAHTFDVNQGSAKVPSQLYHDLFGSYRFGEGNAAGGLLSNTELAINVRNVFNERPPFDASSLSYSTWGDPRLANYSITLSKSF